jgi:pSer/pThr/pTyr-binding forkhead associated (FHA) protein
MELEGLRMNCSQCGQPAEPGARFCASCGYAIAGSAADDVNNTSIISVGAPTGSGPVSFSGGTHSRIPQGSALLVVHRGPGEGAEFALEPSQSVISVGRTPESDIFLDDVTVSRRHAEFRHGAEGWSLRDAGSLNGTYVNRSRVDDRALQGGDEVQIGKFRFIFLVGVES